MVSIKFSKDHPRNCTEEFSGRLDAIQKCISWVERTFHEDKPIFDRNVITFEGCHSHSHSHSHGRSTSTSSGSSSAPDVNINIDMEDSIQKDDTRDDKIIEKGHHHNQNQNPTMIGIFAKQDIYISKSSNERNVLLTLPNPATLSCSNTALRKEKAPAIQELLNETMKEYDTYIGDKFAKSKVGDFDFYRFTDGRILADSEVRLTLFLTLLLCFMDTDTTNTCNSTGDDEEDGNNDGDNNGNGDDHTIQHSDISADMNVADELGRLAEKWSPYLSTWPHEFSSLPPFWSETEVENIKGTCFSQYMARLQDELIENWENIVGPSLAEAGIYKYVPAYADNSDSSEERHTATRTLNDLPIFYQLAVGAVQSRTHGSNEMSDGNRDMLGRATDSTIGIVLHPLLDLVNGERAEEHVNVEMRGGEHGTILYASRDIKAGEELVVSYEDTLTLSYLQRFGFLPFRDGLPDPRNGWLPLSLPAHLVPAPEEQLRWKKLKEFELSNQNISSEMYATGPFALMYDNEQMRKHRKNPAATPYTCPPQLDKLYACASILLCNEKGLRDIPQEGFLESYDPGKMVVQIIDHWLSRLSTPSNEYDFELIGSQSQSWNFRMGTYMRMLEREILVKWRHAVCIRWGCYDYDGEIEGTGVKHVPPILSKCCYICKATFHVKKCTRCKMISYCSVSCQKEHWREGHKEVCGKAFPYIP